MEGAHSVSLYQSLTLFSSTWNRPQDHLGALMSHYNSYQTIFTLRVHTCAQAFVCTQVRASLKRCGLTLTLILDCLCRVSVISWLSISPPPSLSLLVSPALSLCMSVSVRGGQWALGYNCIALPSHSVSTPICLFNIQLSTLDLEASMTAQSHRQQRSRGWLLPETTEMIERGVIEGREKEMRSGKTRCKMLSLRQRWAGEQDG